jgi:hypothetical protein
VPRILHCLDVVGYTSSNLKANFDGKSLYRFKGKGLVTRRFQAQGQLISTCTAPPMAPPPRAWRCCCCLLRNRVTRELRGTGAWSSVVGWEKSVKKDVHKLHTHTQHDTRRTIRGEGRGFAPSYAPSTGTGSFFFGPRRMVCYRSPHHARVEKCVLFLWPALKSQIGALALQFCFQNAVENVI